MIFADPPYHNEQFSTVKKLLGLLKVGGCMVLSHSGRGGILDKTGIVVVDNRSYGNAYITLYRREF
jgi:16S rRNA G966 N2-methylase RsmD